MSNACREFASTLVWQSQSIFGRLVFLASRLEGDSRYRDAVMAEAFQARAIHEALADLHTKTYQLWTGFTPAQQRKDLLWYMHEGGHSPQAMIEAWVNSPAARALQPLGADAPDAFTRDLAIHLLMISVGIEEDSSEQPSPAGRRSARTPPTYYESMET